MTAYAFTAYGVPAPQGSKRIGRHGNRPVIIDDNPPKLKAWRAAVEAAGRECRGAGLPLEGPVSCRIDVFMPRPKSVARGRPSVPPDIDKVTRACLDACTAAELWGDDGQVVDLHVRQWYATAADPAGARFLVMPVVV